MSGPVITDMTDTARWVAVYRANETARPDALFRDPYADRLADERGRAIAAATPPETRSGWPWVIRTKLVDDLVLASIAEGCDRVLNLAAGFDARPYRLALPAELSWIEADLPSVIDAKEPILASEKPQCRLRRERVDLTSAPARTAFLSAATSGAARALVITEGFLTYLEDDMVRSLASDLAAQSSIRWWISDLSSPAVRDLIRKMGARMDSAPLRFAPPNGVAFFEALGWEAREIQSLLRWAARFRRVPLVLRLLSMLPEPNPRNPGKARWGGVIRFERPSLDAARASGQ